MLALRYENDLLSVSDVPPRRVDGEALVRVTLSGICNTDVEIARGYAGFQGTLGHEFVGVIAGMPEDSASRLDADEASSLRVGQRVVGEINAGCGHCELCVGGDARHCLKRTVLGIHGRDGAHAEYLQLPVANLLPVPDEVSDYRAVFVEPLAAALGITERVAITKETRVAVIGDGKLGLLCAQVLALKSERVLLVGKHGTKLRIAAARGIETAIVAEARGREGRFDVVVEASGADNGFALALDLLRPRGTLVLKSTFHGETKIEASRIVVNEISIVGSRCGRFAPALELLAQNAVDVESLISEEHPLRDAVHAMQRATERGILKVLIRQ